MTEKREDSHGLSLTCFSRKALAKKVLKLVILIGEGPSFGRGRDPGAQYGAPRPSLQHNSLFFWSWRGETSTAFQKLGRAKTSLSPSLPHLIILTLLMRRYQQIYSIKHDITGVQCLMPGLILAIRKVVRLKVIDQFRNLYKFNTFTSIRFQLALDVLFPLSWQNLIYGLEKFL